MVCYGVALRALVRACVYLCVCLAMNSCYNNFATCTYYSFGKARTGGCGTVIYIPALFIVCVFRFFVGGGVFVAIGKNFPFFFTYRLTIPYVWYTVRLSGSLRPKFLED